MEWIIFGALVIISFVVGFIFGKRSIKTGGIIWINSDPDADNFIDVQFFEGLSSLNADSINLKIKEQ